MTASRQVDAVAAQLADGRVWAVEQECLTVSEVRSMRDWLRSVAQGSVQQATFRADSFDGLEWYTELNLAPSLAASAEADVTGPLLLEACPPGRSDDDDNDFYSYFELVRMAPVELVAVPMSSSTEVTAKSAFEVSQPVRRFPRSALVGGGAGGPAPACPPTGPRPVRGHPDSAGSAHGPP